jgi:ubiquinone/menaquinone biosynthesis C-methylase UbiE
VSSTSYLLGDSDPELLRLENQHRVWRDATHDGWRQGGLKAGDRVLDVGCGPGFTTLELAHAVGPTGSVVGLDPSDRFHRYLLTAAENAGLDNVDVRLSTIEALEDEGGFDMIHVRWVLCFLSDPGAAIAKLAGLLNPGGRLVTLDYFNYEAFALAPRVPTMKGVVRAIGAFWARSGGSLDVQGETPSHCAKTGLAVTDVSHVSGIARPGDPSFAWPEEFLRDYVPRLVEEGLLEPETGDTFLRDWARWKDQPGTFLFLPPLLRVIATKPD